MTVYRILKLYNKDDTVRYEVYPYALGRHNILKKYMYPLYFSEKRANKTAENMIK